MIDILLTKLIEILVDMGYWGVFLASMGLFPVEVVIAVFSASPDSNIWITALVSSTGALIAGLPVYFLGYIFSEDVLYRWLNGKGKFLRIKTGNIENSKKKIAKSGFIYVFLTRFVPWLRIVASIAAGYIKVNIFQYSVAVFLGSFVYTMVIAYLGLKAGHNWEIITDYLQMIERWIVIILIGIAIGYILFVGKKKILSRVRNKT